MYTYKTIIRLHDTDAAGILFFSNQFKMMHDAYESLLESCNYGFRTMIPNENFFFPIVHAEADYKAPLVVGDEITIHVKLEKIGTTSVIFTYEILKSDGTLVGVGKTVHVTTDKKTRTKIPIPETMRKALSRWKSV